MTVSSATRALVAGDGIIGSCIALHLAARGVSVTMLCPGFPGAASPASAGMLAPSVERSQGPAQIFSDRARAAWPAMHELVRSCGGPAFDIRRDGILRVARNESEAARVRNSVRDADAWLTAEEARRRFPLLGDVAGAALYAGDGVVDAPAALAAAHAAAFAHARIVHVASALVSVASRGAEVAGQLANGQTIDADLLVLATGAWTGSIAGLPRVIPVRPLRGTLVAVECQPPAVPVYDAEGHVYVLARGGQTIIGATSDDVGFDVASRASDATRLLQAAGAMMPALGSLSPIQSWTGLRPVTPDGLPVIGRDPVMPQLVYACGHGRNGFLQAALTAEVVASIAFGGQLGADIAPFNPTRFS